MTWIIDFPPTSFLHLFPPHLNEKNKNPHTKWNINRMEEKKPQAATAKICTESCWNRFNFEFKSCNMSGSIFFFFPFSARNTNKKSSMNSLFLYFNFANGRKCIIIFGRCGKLGRFCIMTGNLVKFPKLNEIFWI